MPQRGGARGQGLGYPAPYLAEEARLEPRKSRSPEELEEINGKIDELAKLVPLDHQEYFLSFLEYWLS